MKKPKPFTSHLKTKPTQRNPDKTFRELFLKDLDEFEMVRLAPPDVVKIKELLKK
jgi:hypothetical protein